MSKIREAIKIIQDYRQGRQAYFAEQQRLLDRQKNLQNGDNVYLVQNFLYVAVLPLAHQDQAFRSAYGKKAEVFKACFHPFNPRIPLGWVPLASVKDQQIVDETKLFLEDQVDKQAEDLVASLRGQLEKDLYWQNQPLGPEEWKKNLLKYHLREYVFPAFRLNDLGEFLTDIKFDKYEQSSIKAGRGNLVINFWQAVRDMQDYSHLFSEDEFDGKKRDENKDVIEWVQSYPQPIASLRRQI